MALILNLRGTNGSGKTTLARAFLPPNLMGDAHGGPIDLVRFPSPTKRNPDRQGFVEGYGNGDLNCIVVGSYRTACGGLDTIASFDRSFRAIRRACKLLDGNTTQGASVIAEGILASTVYGSWAEFATEMNEAGHKFAFCYMTTPLEVCLERIKQRQKTAGKEREIKEDLVADKVKAIAATREKAMRDGHMVYDLPWTRTENAHWRPSIECHALTEIMAGRGGPFRAS